MEKSEDKNDFPKTKLSSATPPPKKKQRPNYDEEEKLQSNIFEENRELKQQKIDELKDGNAKLREEIRTLREQIEKIPVTSLAKNHSVDKMEISTAENKESSKVPPWLPDVLHWIKRTELAQSSLSTSCWAFNQFCWRKLHGRVKPHIVPKLTFLHEWDEEGNSRTKLETANHVCIPIASTNPPEYITGFKEIKFGFLDGRALQFIRTICPLLNGITILFDLLCSGNNPKFGQISQLMALLAPKTFQLGFEGQPGHGFLLDFGREFPNILDKIQALSLAFCTNSDLNLLAEEWLPMPMDGGKPKFLYAFILHQSGANIFFESIKEKFLNSMEPVNFLALIESDRFDLPIFLMENEGTDEILELYAKQNSNNETVHFLVRQRKGGGEAQRSNWEEHFNRTLDTTIFMP